MLDLKAIVNLISLIVVIGGGFHFTGRVSQSLETLTRLVESHGKRLDNYDRVLGRGIPPPEVVAQLEDLRRRMLRLEQQ